MTEDDGPSQADLERDAVPGTVRRAPRYRAFAVVGVLLGVLLGTLVVLLTDQGRTGMTGVVLLFVVLGFALFGLLVAGLVVVLLDRRPRR